jgi:hypothetical protein
MKSVIKLFVGRKVSFVDVRTDIVVKSLYITPPMIGAYTATTQLQPINHQLYVSGNQMPLRSFRIIYCEEDLTTEDD